MIGIGCPDSSGKVRHALLFGNTYRSSPKKNHVLPSCQADLLQMLQKIQSLNFVSDNISWQLDCRLELMKDVTEEFLKKVPDGETTLFYFSGHGAQVDNANILYSEDLKEFNLFKSYLSKVENKPGTHIIILDCCRTAGKGSPGDWNFLLILQF